MNRTAIITDLSTALAAAGLTITTADNEHTLRAKCEQANCLAQLRGLRLSPLHGGGVGPTTQVGLDGRPLDGTTAPAVLDDHSVDNLLRDLRAFQRFGVVATR